LEKEEYQIMYELEETHWWYVGMRAIVFSLLDRHCENKNTKTLDAGCGTGIMLEYLRRYGITFGIDVAQEAIAYCMKRGERNISQASASALPFDDKEFDLVTSFDVICTLESDAELSIREFHRVLKKDGVLLLRVPAYNWLRGHHDLAVHVEHRFTTQEVKCALEALGFHVEKATYCNIWLLPLALFKRLILDRLGIGTEGSDVKPLPWPVNGIFAAILASEAELMRWIDIPLGLSVVALARRVR
jgi:SAM-dependent methyltransferase